MEALAKGGKRARILAENRLFANHRAFIEHRGNDLNHESLPFPRIWDGFLRPAGDSQTFKMRAVFEITEDEQSRKDSIWTGCVVSQTGDYTVYK